MINDIEKFVAMYNDKTKYPSVKSIAKVFGVTDRSVRRMAEKCRSTGIQLVNRNNTQGTENVGEFDVASETELTLEEVSIQNIELAKKLQRAQDKARISNKSFRDGVRIENLIAELSEQLNIELKRLSLSKQTKYHEAKGAEAFGIVHWSDQHLNELVNLPYNKYNWEIAGKRLRKHVSYCKKMAKAFDIKNVLVAMTGDLLNSDRRMDEIVGNAGNRAKACVLAADLYQQALLDLNEDLNVTVAGISGNESRIPKDVGWNPEVASDNYDFIIYEILSRLLESKGVHFIKNYDPSEVVVKLGNQHILLVHGHGAIDNKAPGRSIQQIKGRYLEHNGVTINMVIWGHVHEAMIADLYARSSSLVGTNDYAEKALGLSGRSSQNFYIISEDTGFHGVKIDLQNTEGVAGYSVQKQLETYNTKSMEKAVQTTVIHKLEV